MSRKGKSSRNIPGMTVGIGEENIDDALSSGYMGVIDRFSLYVGTPPSAIPGVCVNWDVGTKRQPRVSGHIDTRVPVTITKDNVIDYIIDAGSFLDEQNVPGQGRWMIIDPKIAALIRKSDLKDVTLK